MRPTLRVKIPSFSTVVLTIVLITVISFQTAGSYRGMLFYAFAGIMVFRMTLRREPIRWGHLFWTLGFYALGALSKYWAYYPVVVELISGSLLFAMLLNWAVAEYICQEKRGLDHICRIMVLLSVLLIINFALNATADNGRLSTETNANIIGTNAAFLFGFVMYAAKEANWRKISLDILLGVLLILVLLTGSRKALTAAAVFVVAFFLFWSPEKGTADTVIRVIGLGAACLVAVLLIMNVQVLYDALGNRLVNMYRYVVLGEEVDGSAVTRTNMVTVGIELFMSKNPILGLGLNNFKYLSGFWTYSHNNYIELLCSLGIVGILVFYVPLGYFTVQAFQLWRKKVPGAILPLTILILQFVNDIGQVSYYSFQINIFLGIAIGYIYLMRRQLKEKEEQLESQSNSPEAEAKEVGSNKTAHSSVVGECAG